MAKTMNPTLIRSTRNSIICPVCNKEFFACRSDKKTCSSACKHKLHVRKKQVEAARNMAGQVQELYKNYQLSEQTKRQTVNY